MNYSHISRFSINLNLKKILIFLSSIIFKINCKKNFLLKLKSILKTNNIVLTSQGRSALFYILKSIISDKKREIIISPYTLPEVIFCIKYSGGTPILVDINIETGLLDLESLKKKINSKTAGVIITHLFSDLKNYKNIKKVVKMKSCYLIEDSAINFGSEYKNNFIGKDSDFVFFSFNLIKNLNLFYGGMIYAKDKYKLNKIIKSVENLNKFPLKELIKQFFLGTAIYLLNKKLIYNLISKNLFIWFEKRKLKYFLKKIYPGKYSKKKNKTPINYSYDFPFYSAKLGLEQLKDFKFENKSRIRIARKYYKKLFNIDGIIAPKINSKFLISVFLEYPIIVKNNKKVKLYQFLLSKGIYLRNHWYINSSKYLNTNIKFKNSEYLENNILCLPTHNEISIKYINLICDEINNFFSNEAKR